MKVLVSDTSVLIDRSKERTTSTARSSSKSPCPSTPSTPRRRGRSRSGPEHPASVVAAARSVIFAQMVDDPSPAPRSSPPRRTRSRSAGGCSASSRSWSAGRTRPTRSCWNRRGRRSAGAGAAPARTMPGIRAPPSCLTRTGCRPSTIPSRAEAPCRWKRSAWGWRPMPAISTWGRCSSTR